MYKPWGKCDPEKEKALTFFKTYSLQACMKGTTLMLSTLIRTTLMLSNALDDKM